MVIVYFAHSYRDRDLFDHFGSLILQNGLTPSVDVPSPEAPLSDPTLPSLNAAKLERKLRDCHGMLAFLTHREGGVSPYIMFEIGMCLRAAKPLLVFIEDRLPDDILPSGVVQRRFSRREYLLETAEHEEAVRALAASIGSSPPPRHRPKVTRRSCLLLGLRSLPSAARHTILQFVEHREYRPIPFSAKTMAEVREIELYSDLAAVDVYLRHIDDASAATQFLAGVAARSAIPEISFTTKDRPTGSLQIADFQPRRVDPVSADILAATLEHEFDLFEQQFLDIDKMSTMQLYGSHLTSRGDKNIFINYGQMTIDQRTVQVERAFVDLWERERARLDLRKLEEELSRLHIALAGGGPGLETTLAAVGESELQARSGNGPKLLSSLRKAGKAGLAAARSLGCELAAKLIAETLSTIALHH